MRLSARAIDGLVADLETRWTQLCDQFAPFAADIWRFNQPARPLGAAQGWKLHLSATPPAAADLFSRCAPTLSEGQFHFKVADGLKTIRDLNRGVPGLPFSQIGKIMTIYCPEPTRARALAETLHGLTLGLPGPDVSSDLPFRPGSRVFYRYGAYENRVAEIGGVATDVYLDPAGAPTPDRRTRATAVPPWIEDPFQDEAQVERPPTARLAANRYKAFKCLARAGKGGVYLARDTLGSSEETRVLKEGLRRGGVDLDGRDGRAGIEREHRNLRAISRIIPAPRVTDFFRQDGNAYLVMDHVPAPSLAVLLGDPSLGPERRLAIGGEVAGIVARLHEAGWCWRDCKPEHFLVDAARIVAIDFGTAMRRGARPRLAVGTPGYAPDRTPWVVGGARAARQDLFALGVTLLRLFAAADQETHPDITALPPPSWVDPEAVDLIGRFIGAGQPPEGAAARLATVLTRDGGYRPR
jgi:hypothetical protein